MSAQRANQLLEAGLWLRLSGDHSGARRLFEQALRMDPSNEKAARLLQEAPADAFNPTDLPRELKAVQPAVSSPAAPVALSPESAAAASEPTQIQVRPALGSQPPAAYAAAPVTQSAGPGFGFAPSQTPAPFVPPKTPVPTPPAQTASERPASPRFVPTTPIPIARPDIYRLPSDPHSPARAGTPPSGPPKELAGNATSGWDFKSSPSEQIPPPPPDVRNPMDWAVEPPISAVASDDSEVRREEVRVLLKGARELMDLDDHSGALELILKADKAAPGDPQVKLLKEKSESTLQAMYESKLGDLSVNPTVKLKDDEIIWLNLDHRAGFVLAQIDGGVSFEDLFAVSGMSRLDTARILAQLLEEGVIG